MHGGNVKAESLGRNKGATFRVTLPLLKVDTAKLSSQELRPIVSYYQSNKKIRAIRLDGLRIIIVEDDLGVREALLEMLTHTGAEVKAAPSAAAAMEVLKEFSPDVMVIDISMPGEDGYSLLRRIRKQVAAGGKIIPAIALTALASDKDRGEAFASGFQMHLAKPIDIDILTGALQEIIERGQELKPPNLFQ